MASIRIDTVQDEKSGQVFAEVYVDDGAQPVLRSEPAFASHDDLVQQFLTMCRAHFPDHFPFVDDPTIGI